MYQLISNNRTLATLPAATDTRQAFAELRAVAAALGARTGAYILTPRGLTVPA